MLLLGHCCLGMRSSRQAGWKAKHWEVFGKHHVGSVQSLNFPQSLILSFQSSDFGGSASLTAQKESPFRGAVDFVCGLRFWASFLGLLIMVSCRWFFAFFGIQERPCGSPTAWWPCSGSHTAFSRMRRCPEASQETPGKETRKENPKETKILWSSDRKWCN